MSDWKEYKLSEIVEIIKDGYQPNSNDVLNYIGLEHIEQETLRLNSIGKSTDVTSNKFKFQANDVLFGKLRCYFRKVVKPNFNGICSTDIWVCRAKQGFSQNFIFYFLANWDFVNTADGGEGGTRMPRADWEFLKNTVWYLPEILEQTAIASILSSLDNKIDLLHNQNKTLEEFAETLFRQWFIEEAKAEWEEKGLDEIAVYLNGLALQKYPVIGYDYLPVIKIKEMKQGISENTDKCSNEIPSQYIINNGDVLFSWSGSLEVVVWHGGKGALNQHLFKVSSTKYPKWLYYFATKQHLENFRMIAESKSTTMGHIQREHLREAKILIPPDDLFIVYDKAIAPMFDKLIININEIFVLKQFRDSLLPKLMSGDLKVNM